MADEGIKRSTSNENFRPRIDPNSSGEADFTHKSYRREQGKSSEFEDLSLAVQDTGANSKSSKQKDRTEPNSYHPADLERRFTNFERVVIIQQKLEALNEGITCFDPKEREAFSAILQKVRIKLKEALRRWSGIDLSWTALRKTGVPSDPKELRRYQSAYNEYTRATTGLNQAFQEYESIQEEIEKKMKQASSDDSSPGRLLERPEQLFIISRKVKALNKGIACLVPKEREAFSTRLQEVYEDIKAAFYLNRKPANASDDQLAQNLADATNDLGKALEKFEVLHKEIANKLVPDLDERFEDTTAFYRGFRDNVLKLLMDQDDYDQDRIKRAEKLAKEYDDLPQKFEDGKKYGTCFDCEQILKEMENKEKETIKIFFPHRWDIVAKEMKSIKEDSNYLSSLIDEKKLIEHIRGSEIQQGRFWAMERETLRKMLNANPERRLSAIEELKSVGSNILQLKKWCETETADEIEAQVRYIMPILKRFKLSETPDQEWPNQFQKLRDDALREWAQSTDGQAFDILDTFVSEVRKKVEYCQRVDKAAADFRSDIDSINDILEKYNMHDVLASFNDTVDKELQPKLDNALLEGAQGTTGQAFDTFQQFASMVKELRVRCQNIYRDIDSLNDVLKKHNMHVSSDSLIKTANKKLEDSLDSLIKTANKKLEDSLQEVVQGTTGQAFDTFQQFASKVQKLKERCQDIYGNYGYMGYISSMLKEDNMRDISDSFNKAVDEELQPKLGDALQEVAQGTTGQAFDTFLQFASKIQKLRECCWNVNTNINSICGDLQISNLDDISVSFKKAANKELQPKLADLLRNGIEGPTEQAFDTFQQFASKFEKMKEQCEEVTNEDSTIFGYECDINLTLAAYSIYDITEPLEKIKKERQQKKSDALREIAQEGTTGQAFDALQRHSSKLYRLKSDCSTIGKMISSLRSSSNAEERANLVKQRKDALVEALEGKDERPAFRGLEQKLNQKMQEQFHSYQSKIAKMKSVYQHLADFQTDFLASSIVLHQMDDSQKNSYKWMIELLESNSKQFDERRKNAEQKSDGDRVGDVSRLMETLSEIKDYTQRVEVLGGQLIDNRRQDLIASCQNVRRDIASIRDTLKTFNLDDISTSFNEVATKELQQNREDALQEGAQGTAGPAFDTLLQFASKVQKLKEDCSTINDIMHQPEPGSDAEEERANLVKQRKDALAQALTGQAFGTFQQFASKVQKLREDCSTINDIIHQLEPSSNTEEERANLVEQRRKALVEALEGSDERPAFRDLEPKLNQKMLERFHACKSKIADMKSIYQHFPNFQTDFKTLSIVLPRINDADKHGYNEVINKLEEHRYLSNEFDQRRKNAGQKPDGDRVEDTRLLMETLSKMENHTKRVEELSEQLIDHRFDQSQAAVTKSGDWLDRHPNEPLAEKYRKASAIFTDAKEKLRGMSGSTRARGNLLLGEMVYNIERLENEINSKKKKMEWMRKLMKRLHKNKD